MAWPAPLSWRRRTGGRDRRLSLAGLGMVVAGIAILVSRRFGSPSAQPQSDAGAAGTLGGGVILIIGGIVSAVGILARRPITGAWRFGVAAALLIIVLSYGRLMAEPARSYAALARTIAQRAPDAVLVCYPRYIQSLPFYAGRRVILVGAKTELDLWCRAFARRGAIFLQRSEGRRAPLGHDAVDRPGD